MSKWEKLLKRILSLSKDMRFDELRKVLESYGYRMEAPRSGSSHYTFRKTGCQPITIPNMSQSKRSMLKWFEMLWKARRIIMKTMDEYMALPYRLEIIPDTEEGGFVGAYPELPGCLTSGETIEEVARNAEDAKRAWFAAALEEGLAIREPESLEAYSGQFKLRIPKSLHRSLAEHARSEGTSMNQYCLYLLAKNDAAYGL